MEYEVYRHKDATDEEFETIDAMFKRVLTEDKYLCTNAQKNFEANVYVSGELHSRMEKGPLFVQSTVRRLLTEHHAREKKLGREIWPARQSFGNAAAQVEQDEEFCSGLTCTTNNKLEW